MTTMSDDQLPLDWPDETRNRHILTSMFLAIGVAPLVVLLHEYAHAVVQLVGGATSSTVSAMSAEESGELSPVMDGWAAAAGPLFSLLLGGGLLATGPAAAWCRIPDRVVGLCREFPEHGGVPDHHPDGGG